MVIVFSYSKLKDGTSAQIRLFAAALAKPEHSRRLYIFQLFFRSQQACFTHYISQFLAKARGHMPSTQVIPLDCPAWLAKGTGIPVLHGTIKIRKTTLSRLSPLGHYMDGSLKYSYSLPVKKCIYLAWSFS